MLVNEIFTSIEGEGIRSGYPCTFIRLYGCNLNCSYCDTRYSCEGDEYEEMSVFDIVSKCMDAKVPRITITGGEPLIHEGIADLVKHLLYNGFKVNIETNGSVNIHGVLQELCLERNLTITMDYKSLSSEMYAEMDDRNLPVLGDRDVLKFVVGGTTDLYQMKRLLEENSYLIRNGVSIFVSPIFGQIELSRIVNFLLEHKLYEVRMQVQLHKVIWDPKTRGV